MAACRGAMPTTEISHKETKEETSSLHLMVSSHTQLEQRRWHQDIAEEKAPAVTAKWETGQQLEISVGFLTKKRWGLF